jgi:ABC-type nitrate/sulfonate/bicarbonate transport system substrate-binding protein
LRRDGYPILADVADLSIRFTALYAQSFVAQHPETVENVIRALFDASYLSRNRPTRTRC